MNAVVTNDALPVASESAAIVQVIERAALNPAVDIDKMERLLQMHERIKHSEAEAAFNTAMSAAQGEMGRISTDATNPQTRSNYATYGKLDRILRPIYTKHGFSLSFGTKDPGRPDCVRVVCMVARGAYSREYQIDMPADGKGAKGNDVMTKTHATGAAAQYGMRYLLKLIFNVAIGEDDDDGNGASEAAITTQQAADLRALMEEAGFDDGTRRRFLEYIGAASVEQIPAVKFSAAVKAVESKRRKS